MAGENNKGIQSVTVSIAEQQITDNVTIVHAGNVDIMESVEGEIYDYHFSMRVEETEKTGIMQTCHLCSDIDEALYRQIEYKVPENKYGWPTEYNRMYDQAVAENPEKTLNKMPVAPASEHMAKIAEAIGKSVIWQCDDWISTLDVENQGGSTYASLISELVGWSARVPRMMINCYIRSDGVHVVQRGHETNTIDLTQYSFSMPKIKKKIVRTTWGSTPWSRTNVTTKYKHWSEFIQEPADFGGGDGEDDGSRTTRNSDGLVEETIEESDSGKIVTHYTYATGPNGEKYLETEVQEKYERDSYGVLEHVDTITTTHKMVSATQSHVFAQSEDDSYLGSTVSTNNFDDRATPYKRGGRGHGGTMSRGAYLYSMGIGMLVYDENGNVYNLMEIVYHDEAVKEQGATIQGLSLIDTDFPIYGKETLEALTEEIQWMNRKTEEVVTLDVYGMEHLCDFNDKFTLSIDGMGEGDEGISGEYFLRSNTALQSETIVNKQTLELVRWY